MKIGWRNRFNKYASAFLRHRASSRIVNRAANRAKAQQQLWPCRCNRAGGARPHGDASNVNQACRKASWADGPPDPALLPMPSAPARALSTRIESGEIALVLCLSHFLRQTGGHFGGKCSRRPPFRQRRRASPTPHGSRYKCCNSARRRRSMRTIFGCLWPIAATLSTRCSVRSWWELTLARGANIGAAGQLCLGCAALPAASCARSFGSPLSDRPAATTRPSRSAGPTARRPAPRRCGGRRWGGLRATACRPCSSDSRGRRPAAGRAWRRRYWPSSFRP